MISFQSVNANLASRPLMSTHDPKTCPRCNQIISAEKGLSHCNPTGIYMQCKIDADRGNLFPCNASNLATKGLVMRSAPTPRVAVSSNDAELVRRALARDDTAFRTIMERHNRRLYRVARSILRNDSEAEDVVQEAYVNAFAHLAGFRGDSSLAAWLSRITMNEALGRLRRERPAVELEVLEAQLPEAQIIQFPQAATSGDPERTMAQREILQLVERATDNLPEIFRTVFVTRVIEGMSVEETAELLGLQSATVKTRLHRARRLVREQLDKQIGPVLMDAFPFAGRRCERMTNAVMKRLGLPS